MTAAFNGTIAAEASDDSFFDQKNKVRRMHPVYVLPWGVAEEVRAHFESKPLI